ncbi:hypothetical protein SDC9_101381 [bioreactor metagenome]|uniref:Uncharacterized protein n=1 Tax=bioreactor metagenome TaxID=1076179 RepID=A0A645AUL2_9ZZZZ
MAVFAHDEGPTILVRFGTVVPGLDESDGWIHGSDDIGGELATLERVEGMGTLAPFWAVRPFIVDGTSRIIASEPACTTVMVMPVATLIAKRPDDDRRMIVITTHHALYPLQEAGSPSLIAADAVVVGMRLNIRFIHHIQPVDVAQFIPAFIVGVMAGTHCVEVVLLHQADVLNHAFGGKGFCPELVVFMPVHTLDQNTLAIDQQRPSLDLHFAEPECNAMMHLLVFQ